MALMKLGVKVVLQLRPCYCNVSLMNLEQSKLTVNGAFNSNGGLLWEKAICSQGCQCIDYEIMLIKAPFMLFFSCLFGLFP
jgi:hypothetical protein